MLPYDVIHLPGRTVGIAVRRTLRDPKTAHMELERTGAEAAARFFALLFDALAGASTPLEAAPRIAAAVAETIAGWCALWIHDRATGELRLAGASHCDVTKEPLARRLAEGWLPPKYGALPGVAVSLNGAVILGVEDKEKLTALFGSRERAYLATELGSASALVAPLTQGHRSLGLLVAVSADPVESVGNGRVALLSEIARRVATVVAHLHRLDSARQASQQLTLTNLHLQAILEGIPQGVVVASAPEGRVVSTSRALTYLLGRPMDPRVPVSAYPQLYGFARPTGELYRADELPWVYAARTGESSGVEEMVIRGADGRGSTALCSASPILDEIGETIGAVALLQDISDRKELELQKDEFLAMVAHELKTPLTAVKGYVQLILRLASQRADRTLGPRELGMLEVADQQVSRLSQLVFDLLDFSLIRMGRLDLRCVDFSLTSLARDVVAQLQLVAQGVDLEFVGTEDAVVRADPHRVEQVLTNLISNAIKATAPGGHVQIRVRRMDGSVVASVHDDGAGMPREVQERIFERYYRGPDRCHEGMGLGLYISKGIVDAHGGRIWLESEVGKGSSFHFSLAAVEK